MVVAGLDMVKNGECTLAVVDGKGNFLEERVLRFTPPRTPPARAPQAVKIVPKPAVTAVKPPESSSPPAADAAPAPAQEDAPIVAVVSEPPETSPMTSPAPVQENVEPLAPGAFPREAVPEAEVVAATEANRETEVVTAAYMATETEVAAKTEPAAEAKVAAPAEPVAAPESMAATEVAPDIEAAHSAGPAPHVDAVPMGSVAAAETAAAAELASSAESAPGGPTPVPEAGPTPQDTASGSTPAELSEAAQVPPPVPPPVIDYMARARATIRELVSKHAVRAVAIGTGTGARELEATLKQILTDEKIENVLVAAVNDAGIAVYSSSRVAREELPELAVSARCAVSLARRLQDPLTELVKIDPKLIGVGQYQHDVDQKELHRGLLQTVQFCVNRVGVDVNTARYPLPRSVAGLNDRLAHRIVGFRNTSGPFPSRQALLKVPGLDSDTFEQASGFLRIRGGENPLDGTAVHPESYPLVERMAAALGVSIAELIGNKDRVSSLKLEEFAEGSIGLPTLNDIREELLRPGRDPRKTFALPKFRSDVKDLSDLKKGMTLEGTVTNVTNFGAFVDVGVHQDGLVHLSQMSNRFIRDPREAVRVGDVVQVKVISVEVETRRIGLSMKALLISGSKRRRRARKPGGKPPQAEVASKASERIPDGAAAESDRVSPSSGPERRGRRDRDRGRLRRRDSRRAEKPTPAAIPEPKPQVPEPTLQEKIAILQSKFRGIN